MIYTSIIQIIKVCMVQVSRRLVSKKVEERILSLFISSIVLCNSQDTAFSLIDDLLTPTEKIMLAKRFSIAFMLLEGYDYDTISRMLKVSYATIGSISMWLKIKGEGFRKIVGEIKRSESLKRIWEEIQEGIADVIASSPGQSWRNSKKLLWQFKQSHQKPF